MKWKVYQVTTTSGQTYIGVTCRKPNERLRELRSRRGIDGKIEILAEFEARDDALALENRLVPVFYQGLNRARGGRAPNVPQKGAKNASSLRVSVSGVEYETVTAAGAAHGVKKTTACYRMGSSGFPDWVYIDPTRRRA